MQRFGTFFQFFKWINDFTLCQKSREILIFPFALQPNNDCLGVIFSFMHCLKYWDISWLWNHFPSRIPVILCKPDALKEYLIKGETIPGQHSELTSQQPFVSVVIGYFSPSLGDSVTTQDSIRYTCRSTAKRSKRRLTSNILFIALSR